MTIELLPEPDLPFRMSMSSVVGANVRAAREAHGWSRDTLSEKLRDRGLDLSRRTLRRLEGGERAVSVDDLVALGLALQVAPLVLLCSPPGTIIVGPGGSPMTDEDGGEASVLGSFVVRQPVDPDLEQLDFSAVGELSGAFGAWVRGGTAKLLFVGLEAVRTWAWETWTQASRVVIYAPQWLLDAFDEVDARAPEHEEQWRLIKEIWPLLPGEVRTALSVAFRTKDFSGVPPGWDVLAWSTEELRKQLEHLVESDQA